MPETTHRIDTQTDRSDVLSLLTTIEVIFRASQHTLNEYSRSSLLLSIAIESQMLLMKLQTMYERWQIHLPFKEACGVDFYDWAKKVKDIIRQMDSSQDTVLSNSDVYCPSKHFLLDLYAILPDGKEEGAEPYFCQMSVPQLVSTQNSMRNQMAARWPEYKRRLSEHTLQSVTARSIVNLEKLHDDSTAIFRLCRSVLSDLSEQLSRLSDMSLRVVKGDEYARLAERIVREEEYGGAAAKRNAKAYFSQWKNRTPESQADAERKYEIEMAVNFISDLKYGRFLGKYIHLKDNMDKHMRGFGKFLFTYRVELSTDELRRLMEQLYRIKFFLEDQQQEQSSTVAAVSPVEKSVAVEAEPIALPTFFSHDLRANAEATSLLLRLLRRAGAYMGRNLTREERESEQGRRYFLWKWHYLHQVFQELCFIEQDTRQVHFAEFLAAALGRKKENVLQSIYRNFEKKSPSVIADIREEFMPVKAMLG